MGDKRGGLRKSLSRVQEQSFGGGLGAKPQKKETC